MVHEGHIAVWLGLEKKIKTDANKHYFSIISVEAILQRQKTLEENNQHSSFKNVVAMQNSEKAFLNFLILVPWNSKW